jgi:pimeloyl-ACP methyl ester carboxylesterase
VGRGIGRLLVDALQPAAARAGLTTLVYLAEPTNRPALRLLGSLGVELATPQDPAGPGPSAVLRPRTPAGRRPAGETSPTGPAGGLADRRSRDDQPQAAAPPAWAEIPSWALIGTVDRVILPATQLFMAERAGAPIVKIKASRLPMISQPGAVTRLIVAAHRATS